MGDKPHKRQGILQAAKYNHRGPVPVIPLDAAWLSTSCLGSDIAFITSTL